MIHLYESRDNIVSDVSGIRHVAQITNANIELLANWLLYTIRDYMYDMPYKSIQINCSNDFYKKYTGPLTWIARILNNTNDFINKHSKIKDIGKSHDEILFVNVSEDMRYGSLYKQLNSKQKIYYINFDLGFDREKREWAERKDPVSLDGLIEYIQKNKIKKIISVNEYFLNHYLSSYNIHLIAVFKHLGIEYNIIDNDPADLCPEGFLRRFCWDYYPRFANLYCLNSAWDKAYNRKVKYIAIPQDYNKRSVKKLREDYRVIILTNSRISNVKNFANEIDQIDKLFDPRTKYNDVVIWYLTLRHIILYQLKLTEFERLTYNSYLHTIFYTLVNYYKYEIINSIKTKRPIDLYGDIGFKEVCSQHYKGSLDNNQIESLFKGNNLYLLLNFSYSYLDASGPVYDMIRRGVPFLNVPTIKSEPLIGLKVIEYCDKKSLNNKIESAIDVYENNLLNKSLQYYRGLLKSSTLYLEDSLLGKQVLNKKFNQELEIHENLMNQAIIDYADNNQDILIKSLNVLGIVCKQGN